MLPGLRDTNNSKKKLYHHKEVVSEKNEEKLLSLEEKQKRLSAANSGVPFRITEGNLLRNFRTVFRIKLKNRKLGLLLED